MNAAKLMGRLGWRGQCSCCSGPRGHDQIRAEEKRETRQEAERERCCGRVSFTGNSPETPCGDCPGGPVDEPGAEQGRRS